jgi:hypothetical protein
MAWLAIRELWISFRLIALLVGFVGAGAVVALLPATLPAMLGRLAVGLGAATLLAGAIAAWSIATDRLDGRAGWLVGRSVPRQALVTAWFTTITCLSLLGMATAAVLGWLAATAVSPSLDPVGFAVTAAGIATGVGAAVALGLVAGVLLPPRPAAALVIVLAAAVGMAAWMIPDARPLLPGAAIPLLADFQPASPGTATALASAGVGLLAAAVLILLARLLLRRSDL